MSEAPKQDETTPEEAPAPQQAHGTTNIEELQALKAREGAQAATEQALRQVLSVLDPHPNDQALDYAAILGRLQNVLIRELQQQKA